MTLRIAAEHASYSNFGVDLDNFNNKSRLLAEHCDDLGTDFESITRSANFNILCAESESALADKRAWLLEHFKPHMPEERAERQVALYDTISGTPEQVVATLTAWEKAGMTYFIGFFPDIAYDTSGIELFANEVIPALR